MPTLPTKMDLGQPGSQSRSLALAPNDWPDTSMAPIAGAVAKAGKEITATLQAKQDEADNYEVQKAIIDFDLDQEKRLDDAKRNAAPEAKGFTDGYRSGYDSGARELMTKIPEHLKPKVDEALVRRGAAFEKRAYDFELAERDRWNIQDVNKNTSDLVTRTMGNPDSLDDNASRGVALIRSSRLTQRAKIDAEKKFLDMNADYGIKALIDREIEAGRDAGDIIQRLRKVPRGTISAEPEAGPRAGVEPQSDGMSVLTSTSGAKFRVGGTYADRFSGLINDLEAAGVEIKGDQSGGYAKRNIRGSNKPSEHSFGRAIDLNWNDNAVGSRGAIVDQLGGEDKVRELASKHGLKWGGDFKGSRRDPMHFEIDPNLAPEAKAADAARPVGQRSLTQYAGLPSKTMTDAVERKDLPAPGESASDTGDRKAPRVEVGEDGQPRLMKDDTAKTDLAGAPTAGEATLASDELEESDQPGWHYLTPATRRKLINYARTAGRAVITKGVDDDIARLRLGKEPEAGPDGKTSLDRARAHMTNMQWAKKKQEWDEARSEHEELSSLRTMTDGEAADHVASMVDRAEADGRSVQSAARIQKKADARLTKMLDMRTKDPVRAITGSIGDEVDDRSPPLQNTAAAIKKISEGRKADIVTGPDGVPVKTAATRATMTPQQQWETLFEGRLADQNEVMPYEPEKHRIISKREGEQILMMPKDGKGLDYRLYRQKLEEAAARAEAKFGPKYAKRALEEAIGFHLAGGSAEQKARQASILGKMAKGEPISGSDVRELRDISQIDGVSISGGIDAMARVDRAGRSQGLPSIVPMGDAGRPTIGQGLPQPSERQLEWLRTNPDGWQAFDERFGRGASARVLGPSGGDPWGASRGKIPKREWREDEKKPKSGWSGFFGR